MDQESLNCLDILTSVSEQKEKFIKDFVKKLETDLLQEHQKCKSKLEEQIRKKANNGILPKPDILDRMIPYTDQVNKMIGKVANACLKKELLNEVNIQVVEHLKKHLTPEAALEAKKKFDLICDYSKRKAEGVENTGEMYDANLCLYLMSKTFKKSSLDAYESYYRIVEPVQEWLTNKNPTDEIFIGAIGGGPGSDLTGSLAYISDIWPHAKEKEKWNLTVFDLMHENWKTASSKALQFGFYKHMNKNEAIHSGEVKYSHIDFKQPDTIPTEELSKFEFLTVCWALNESIFNAEFWKKVFECTKKAFIIFVEGVDTQLIQMERLAKEANRKTLFEQFESPRRLIVYPQSQQN